MKNFLIINALLLACYSSAQVFEIPTGAYPYSDIIEWKGMGAMLISKDPNGVSKQVNLTLIGDQLTTIWDQKFSPKGENYYYISSENARYVYFLDNLELIEGKVYFNQLNAAGNVKATSVDIGAAVRKLGAYDYNDLRLVNAVVTDKALVFHYRTDNKKDKTIAEIAVFMTHHNFLAYAVELGQIPELALKDDNIGHWEYTGFMDDQIFFASRDIKNKAKGWSIKEYSSKGKEMNAFFIDAPKGDLLMIENIGFGTTGKYYLKTERKAEKGLLTYIGGKFYLVGGQRQSETSAELTLFEWAGGEWKAVNNMKLNYFIEKKNLQLGIYPMNEGIGYHLDHNGYNKVSLISFTPGKETAHNDFTERTIFNPSSVFEKKEKTEFNVILPGKLLVFETAQLNQNGAVKFELKQR
ncbi:MAG: hypothetical protein A3D92_15165 [Bacteroidetes bacterium RIFCSPHIGHO2_02_FULL_44_7]|nr:MAG: hypothetical protein A3D92_15165 [Bacteroidetes bacterium RIFCSPHIGHO2_02_FULL_44_7]